MTTVDLSPAGAARRAVTTRVLLACGAVAGPLFTAAWILEGATRAHYNPLRHPVSSLELGDLGWTQQANFVVAGGLTLAFAVGLWRALRPLGGSTWGPLLVGAHGIGLLGAGIFVTDPVSGYPPGTPDHLAAYGSAHAALHDLFSVGTFVGLPIACLVLAGASPAGASVAGRSTRRPPAWRSWPGSCSRAWPSTRSKAWWSLVGCCSAPPSPSAGPG
jgi:Protein of unknown function (DUF998)